MRNFFECTYDKEKLLAVYINLNPTNTEVSYNKRIEPDISADFDSDGHLLGIDITSPETCSMADIIKAVKKFKIPSHDSENNTTH